METTTAKPPQTLLQKKRSPWDDAGKRSKTKMPTASAIPPRVMILIVSPKALRTTMEQRMESGMETQIIKVLRQLLRNRRIINAVSHAAIIASRTTF